MVSIVYQLSLLQIFYIISDTIFVINTNVFAIACCLVALWSSLLGRLGERCIESCSGGFLL
jgi:hypothetical protein